MRTRVFQGRGRSVSARVVGDHFSEELGLHTWLREWGSMDRCGGQGGRIHMWNDWGESQGVGFTRASACTAG